MISAETIQSDLLGFVRDAYPDMTVRVEAQDGSRLTIYFVEPRFSGLYAMQRNHYLSHLIPSKYVEEQLSYSVWFELAPGEKPEEIVYPDEELIRSIKPDVMAHLANVGFFNALDDIFCPVDSTHPPQRCHGDFRNAKSVLGSCGIDQSDFFDVFHVLMSDGGFCDCEILYNVSETSRFRAEYWRNRAENGQPYNPHHWA